jgi:hypothetical protein
MKPGWSASATSQMNVDVRLPPNETIFIAEEWWAHLDLNQGPTDYESAALTN